MLTDLGNPVHARAIAGAHHEPGAVEADALLLFHSPLIGFDALEPAFLAEVSARSLLRGGTFLDLSFAKRVAVVADGLDAANPALLLWEAAVAVTSAPSCSAQPRRNRRSTRPRAFGCWASPDGAARLRRLLVRTQALA